MDTISLAGPLEAKLGAMRGAGFGLVVLSARDIVGHPRGQGIEAFNDDCQPPPPLPLPPAAERTRRSRAVAGR